MELEGCKRSFQFLKLLGVSMSVVISDRHRSIAKWIHEACPSTKHYFDIWHVARPITKKLLKASKEKGCEVISNLIRGISKHLYWCTTSSKPRFGSLISAKWHSFLRHVADKHKNHPDTLYSECNHGHLERRKWFKVGNVQFLWYAEQTVFLVHYCRNFLEIHVQSCISDTCTHLYFVHL